MNFKSLQYFLTVAEELNITHAAQRLFISQQSLSSSLSKLEEELGVKLFTRTPRLQLTYAGERLIDLARHTLLLESRILQESHDLSRNIRGVLKVGISHTCGRAILPDIIPEYHFLHPLVEIELMEGNNEELEDWLLKDKIDLMIAYAPFSSHSIESFHLINERLFLVAPRGSYFDLTDLDRQEDPEGVDLSCLNEKPFIMLKEGNRIRKQADQYISRTGFSPEIILETGNIETAFALCARGMGFIFYPELFFSNLHAKNEEAVCCYPIKGEEMIGQLAAARKAQVYHSLKEQDFLRICLQIFQKYRLQIAPGAVPPEQGPELPFNEKSENLT